MLCLRRQHNPRSFHHTDADMFWEAEDRVRTHAHLAFPHLGVNVEVRNQRACVGHIRCKWLVKSGAISLQPLKTPSLQGWMRSIGSGIDPANAGVRWPVEQALETLSSPVLLPPRFELIHHGWSKCSGLLIWPRLPDPPWRW